MRKRTKYINNDEFLSELNKSKKSFCSFTRPEYEDYDGIVASLSDITPEFVEKVKESKAKFEVKKRKEAESGKKENRPKEVDYSWVTTQGLIIRVMDYSHIPDEPGRKTPARTIKDQKAAVYFPPFKHYYLHEDLSVTEVGRSHWYGSLSNGYFCQDQGKLTDELVYMFMLMVERYSTRGNWRNYSFLDEMKASAILQLMESGLKFDESKSSNPFAYFTTTITNSFTRVLNQEKRTYEVRDNIMEANNMTPSHTRQQYNEDNAE